MIPEK
jgi:serine/threonine protein kinase